MRIVTRPDFDGVVCAVLLYDVEHITHPVQWVEPSQMQKGQFDVGADDIIANLPFSRNCALWFDHHITNRVTEPFKGVFKEAPSAAGIIHQYYKGRFKRNFRELVAAADKIDSADLTMDEVLYPEAHDYVMLSMTISNQNEPDEPYWNRLVALFQQYDIDRVLQDPLVVDRCRQAIEENKRYKSFLLQYTHVRKHIAVTDFRSLKKAPAGNRFLVYSLFPDAHVHVKIRHDAKSEDKLVVNVGHSIFNPRCRVNVGQMLSRFEGGGHPGAGSCTFHIDKSDEYLARIITILEKNEPIDEDDPAN